MIETLVLKSLPKNYKRKSDRLVLIYVVLSLLVASECLIQNRSKFLQDQASVFSNEEIDPNEFLKLVASELNPAKPSLAT